MLDDNKRPFQARVPDTRRDRHVPKPQKPVKLEVPHGATTITYDDFAKAKLTFEQQQFMLEFHSAALEQWMAVKLEHDRVKTQAIISATLTEDWRRLIGRAWKLVATLLELRLEAELLVGEQGSGHIFATQADLAARDRKSVV